MGVKYLIPFLVLAIVLSITSSCGAEEQEAVEEPIEEEIAEEETEEKATEPVAEGKLTFSTSNEFPDSWGKVRTVEPSLASFTDIEIGIGEGMLEGQEAFAVSGKLKGEQAISYCLNPDQGVFATLSGLIVDKNNNIKWSQDGYLQGTGSYIKESMEREFLLINSIDKEITEGDTLILIAHVEYGMIEDDETDVDKGVFAEFRKEIKDIIEEEVTEEAVEEPEEGEEDPNTTETSPEETDSATFGEKNAVKKAQDYLAYSAFSYSGLVKQLEFEGYTHEEAVYGVDKCGADWNEQAAKMAQDYLDYSSFSRTELISQLEFEGFTQQQAEYGAQAVGY
jgi:hypothetical protein